MKGLIGFGTLLLTSLAIAKPITSNSELYQKWSDADVFFYKSENLEPAEATKYLSDAFDRAVKNANNGALVNDTIQYINDRLEKKFNQVESFYSGVINNDFRAKLLAELSQQKKGAASAVTVWRGWVLDMDKDLKMGQAFWNACEKRMSTLQDKNEQELWFKGCKDKFLSEQKNDIFNMSMDRYSDKLSTLIMMGNYFDIMKENLKIADVMNLALNEKAIAANAFVGNIEGALRSYSWCGTDAGTCIDPQSRLFFSMDQETLDLINFVSGAADGSKGLRFVQSQTLGGGSYQTIKIKDSYGNKKTNYVNCADKIVTSAVTIPGENIKSFMEAIPTNQLDLVATVYSKCTGKKAPVISVDKPPFAFMK